MAKPAPPPPQPSQTIHIGRKEPDSIEFDFPQVVYPLQRGEEVSLELKIVNHGEPAHVKLAVGASLKEAVLIHGDSPYVKGEEAVPVILRLPKDARTPLKGEIAVTAGYGARKAAFGVLLGDPRASRPAKDEEAAPEVPRPAEAAPPAVLKVRRERARDWRLWSLAALGVSLAAAALLASAGAVVETFTAAWVASALMVVLLLRGAGPRGK